MFNQDPAPFVKKKKKAFQTFAESVRCKSPIAVPEPLAHTGWGDVGTAFDLQALVTGHKGVWSSGPPWEGNGFRQLSGQAASIPGLGAQRSRWAAVREGRLGQGTEPSP